MSKFTRKKLLCLTAPRGRSPARRGQVHPDGSAAAAGDHSARARAHDRVPSRHGSRCMGHAAMIGDGAPAVGGPNDLDALLYPPPALPAPARPGARVHARRDRPGDRDRARRLLPRLDLQRDDPRTGDSGDRGRHPPRPVRQRGSAPPHDPFPRDPPDEHGRGVRDRRAAARSSRTSSPPGRPGSTSITATRRR